MAVTVWMYEVPHFANPADVLITDPTVPAATRRRHRPPDRPWRICPIHGPGLCRRVTNRDGVPYCRAIAPEAQSLHRDLVKRYGAIEGNKTYLAMRNNRQGPFAEGAKYDVEELPRGPSGDPEL